MLYIYKIAITPTTAKIMADAQKMHEFLCGLIRSDRASANMLYKLDEKGFLFVQSDICPDETPFLKLCYKVDVDTELSKINNGDRIHFQLTTDSRKKKTVDGVTKEAYVSSENLIPWMIEKLERYGLNTYKINATKKQTVVFNHKAETNRGGRGSITIYEFDIKGVVTDVNTFRRAWLSGMGRHKAYGNGLFLRCY